MYKLVGLLLFVVSFDVSLGFSEGGSKNHYQNLSQWIDRWDSLLSKHVNKHGGVNYRGFNSELDALSDLLDQAGSMDVSTISMDARKAFYINIYNAFMIENVLKFCRSQSMPIGGKKFLSLRINDIKVPGGNIWDGDYKRKFFGESLNLDDVEHGLIRGKDRPHLNKYKLDKLDARIHAAVNCSAKSCPRLLDRAYRPDSIDAQLETAMKEFITSDKQFALVGKRGMTINSIILWYFDDFENNAKQRGLKTGAYLAGFLSGSNKERKRKAIVAHLNDKSRSQLRLESILPFSSLNFEYLWLINDQKNMPL